MSTPLPPIATPPAVRWREFREQVLPYLVFAGCVVLAAVLWKRSVAAPALIAEAETVVAQLASSQPGTFVGAPIEPLQVVRAGQTLGHVHTTDPRVLAATLAVISAEVEALRASMSPAVDQQRVTLEYQRLQLEWLQARVALASLRAQLQQAEAGLARFTQLRGSNAIAEENYDTARNLRDGLVAQIDAQTRLVEGIAPAVSRFGSGKADDVLRSPADALAGAIRVQQEKLGLAEVQLGPVPLLAPIDGVVSVVHRRSGESVVAGESIATIAATQPVRLIGFVRQPLALEPKVGARVEVRTRGVERHSAETTITEIGRVMEPVFPTILAAINRAGAPDAGLRVHIAPPASLALRPGEHVDVIFRD